MKKSVVAKKPTSNKAAKVEVSKPTPKPVQSKPVARKKKETVAEAPKTVYTQLFAFQGENIVIPRNGRGKSQGGKEYKYSTFDNLVEAVNPVLQKYNLGFTQVIKSDKLVTDLFHAQSNTSIVSDVMLGKPDNMQDYGGRVTYAKRYSLTAILGLSAEEDLDANGSTAAPAAGVSVAPNAPVTKAASDPIKPEENNSLTKTPVIPSVGGKIPTLAEQIAALESEIEQDSKLIAIDEANSDGTTDYIKHISNGKDKVAEKTRQLESLKIRQGGSAATSQQTTDADTSKGEPSKWFLKAKSAIESTASIEALEELAAQVERSTIATGEEKAACVELIDKVRTEKFS